MKNQSVVIVERSELIVKAQCDCTLRLKQFVEGIAVVNDTAERGVKLIQEYISSSRDESLRQDLLVTVKDFKSKLNHSNIYKFYYYIWQGSKKQNFHK